MGKLIAVTGGTKGIGFAILERFAAAGFDLVFCARNAHDVAATHAKLGEQRQGIRVFSMAADLSDKSQVIDFSRFVKNIGDPVDVLVNNAGYFIPGGILEEEEGALEKMMSSNLYSAYHLTRALAADMKLRRSGHIFNICSTASITPYVNGGSYGISKFALLGMTKTLRQELRDFNVKVTAVLPGATLTASWEGVDLPPDRFMKPEDIAETVFCAWNLSERAVVEEILVRPQLGDI